MKGIIKFLEILESILMNSSPGDRGKQDLWPGRHRVGVGH